MKMRPFAIVAVAALLLVSQPIAAQDQTALDLEAYTLGNGLEVILVEDHTAPVVAIDVWYHVGGANDPAGRSGFAHLFEHMMFQGTANMGKDDLQRLINDAGGNYNAYTSIDQTAYYETLPAHQLPLGLWLEADRMASLAVTQTNLDNQRAVVIGEYQQNYGGAPYGFGILELITAPYDYEPYQRAPIGRIEDLNLATVAEIAAFHAIYYVPNNATLVVAGDFEPAAARELIELYYAPIPAGATPPALPAWSPVQQAEASFVTLEDDLIRIPAVLIGYETPPRQHPDYPAMEILNFVLSTGDSSRMQQSLIETGLAIVADTLVSDNFGPSLFGVLLLPNLGTIAPAELEQLYYAELDLILAEGIPQADLDKAINILRAGSISSLESAFGIAERVQTANFYYGDPGAVMTEIDRFTAVSSEDVQRVIREYLSPEDRHVIYINPGASVQMAEPVPFVGATNTPADDAFDADFALAITEPPSPFEEIAFNLPTITENKLANGLTVVVIEAPELPMLTADLIFRGGGMIAPAENAGIVGVMADLLTKGTISRSAFDIAVEIESRGGAVYSYAGSDMVGAGIFALIEDADLAFDLLGDIVLNPRFPQAELNVQITQRRSSLEAALVNPRSQAGRAFSRLVYGAHPYGNQLTLDTLATIDQASVQALYASIRDPANAILIIAGRITTEEALALAEITFGGWVGDGDPPTIDFPPVDNGVGALDIVLIDIPGAEQAEIILGNIGIRGDDPDRYVLSVMNNILGVGLPSRLSQNIRESKGFAYGIGSSFSFPRDIGLFRVSTNVRPETVASALTEILFELERMRTEPVSGVELTGVRDGMIGRFALSLETYQALVANIAAYMIRGLPIGDIALYPDRIAEADPASVIDRAVRYLPTDLLVVVAGDAAVLLEQLQTLGPVTIVQPQ